MGLSPLFQLFLALAVLMILNAARSFSLARKPPSSTSPKSSSLIATGVVSILAAIGLVAAGYYMFQF